MDWEDICRRPAIFLYAGDLPNGKTSLELRLKDHDFIGLSLSQDNARHINHDVTKRHLLPDNTVDIYQSEEVYHEIQVSYESLPSVLNEVYRLLKPLYGVLRVSVPDYRCDIHHERRLKYGNSYPVPPNLINDPLFEPFSMIPEIDDDMLTAGVRSATVGVTWLPVYETLKAAIESSLFNLNYRFYHYYTEDSMVVDPIDYSQGYISRTPDNDGRTSSPYRPLSLVVDCFKKEYSF